MIQQIGLTQQQVHSAPKRSSETTNEEFKTTLNNVSDSGEITVNKYGHKKKYGINLGNSQFGEYFTKEQLESWRQSIDNVDATYCAFLQFVSDAGERSGADVSFSMSYYDFCYLLEQGQVINPQNVGLTNAIIKDRNWDYSVILNETFGVRNLEQNKKQLDIMRQVLDLGLVSNDRGLLSPEDVQELLAKKKYEEQQLLLERSFEKKHLLEAQLNQQI